MLSCQSEIAIDVYVMCFQCKTISDFIISIHRFKDYDIKLHIKS